MPEASPIDNPSEKHHALLFIQEQTSVELEINQESDIIEKLAVVSVLPRVQYFLIIFFLQKYTQNFAICRGLHFVSAVEKVFSYISKKL